MLGLIGKKLGTTRVYTDTGEALQVTVVKAGPNHVLQCKTPEVDGYRAVQLGFDEQKPQRVNKPLTGHFKKSGSAPVKRIREFRDYPLEVKPGETLSVGVFEAGDYIDAIGLTKGRGFQGVVKRWGFHGGPGSHGQKGFSRRPGAIGQRLFPGTVRKGMKMPGHMGQVRRTIQNLQIVQVMEDDQVLLIKGSIPGADGDYVVIRESKKRPKAGKQKAKS